jgi:hypothetical protein
MSHVNIAAIIRNLPYDQFGKETFDKLKKEGLPSSVSELSCPVLYKNAYGKPAIELQELSLGTDNVTREALDYFKQLDLENAYIDGRNIPFDSLGKRSLDLKKVELSNAVLANLGEVSIQDGRLPNTVLENIGEVSIQKGQLSNTTIENVGKVSITGSHTVDRYPLLEHPGLQVRNVRELNFNGEGPLMNHLTDPIELDNVTTHAKNLHFGDIEARDSRTILEDCMGSTVTSNRKNDVTLIPPLGPKSTVRKVFIKDQK